MEPYYNTEENLVPEFKLPDLLTCLDGSKADSPNSWAKKRRKEILKLFEEHVYGKTPNDSISPLVRLIKKETNALKGKATRKEIRVYFTGKVEEPFMDILIYLPNEGQRPHPVFLGLNFFGNHSIHEDPDITLSQKWMRDSTTLGTEGHCATESSRGSRADRWPIEKIIERGYGLATVYCGDLDPDFHDEYQNGIHPLFYAPGQSRPTEHEWGTIGAWSWGLSRALDVFEKDDDIDSTRVSVMGHSRLGKTALWAAAQDERFAMAISNNSGCTGAALSRRRFGETISRINKNFPHWFCDRYLNYNDKEDELPVDQHMLLSLVAPRPVYVASATEDLHADPRGEFLSCLNASPVYELLGKTGLGQQQDPEVEVPIHLGHIGYHLRKGKHSVEDFDWEQFLTFADLHLS